MYPTRRAAWGPPPRGRQPALVAVLLLALLAGLLGAGAAPAARADDRGRHEDLLVFGDEESERAHALHAPDSAVVTGGSGQLARVAQPLDPPDLHAGDLTFTMAVDPQDQNYLTVRFWGGDTSTEKTLVEVNGEQLGYRRSGDWEALNPGHANPVPGRYYHATVLLPLSMTQGSERVEITLTSFANDFATPLTEPSRGFYRAYTHTDPALDLGGEDLPDEPLPTDVADDLPAEERQALVDGYRQTQIDNFEAMSETIDADPEARLSIERYKDDLRFYATALTTDWSPARTPGERRAALERIFQTVDNWVTAYYGDTMSLGNGGHQSDWGGYYGALGEALYIVENLIADEEVLGREAFEAFLAEPFDTGTEAGETSLAPVDLDGGQLTRGEAWERTLKANFDFARSRLSYIYNQVMYTYEGAWEAHEGLRVIGSDFYEGRERGHRIAREALGLAPFLGEEVLVGPEGEELDLFHSLFYHDRTARYTEDYRQIVMKGLATSALDENGEIERRRPLGDHYTTVTQAGLTRENGYVGNYGESTNYLPEWFHRTWGHEGDEELNDDILELALRNHHARSHTRYSDTDADGNRVMRMNQVVDERNTGFPGKLAYVSVDRPMHYASLEHHMVQHPERYRGEEWEETWRHAAEAVGAMQQQLADHQYFNNFAAYAEAKWREDLRLPATYAYVTGGRADHDRFAGQAMAGLALPQTDFTRYTEEQLAELDVDPADYERFAWVDVDNAFVSLRDGDTRIFGALNERQRGYAGNGRLHVQRPDHSAIVQIETEGVFRYRDYYGRMDNIDVDFMEDQQTGGADAPQALAGEIAPITYQPGVGEVRRENFEADHAYSGYPDLLTAQYDRYLFAFNTTREEYGNESVHRVAVPPGTRGRVLDLVSGERLPVRDGAVSLAPNSALVLRLDDATRPETPANVDFTHATPGDGEVALSWNPSAGAESYTVRRATREDGRYTTVARGVTDTHHVDTTARGGRTYYYTVTPVNEHGAGNPSYRAEAEVAAPVSGELAGSGWRDDRLGSITEGGAAVEDGAVTIDGGDGAGLGRGDDYMLHTRDIDDALHFVNRPLVGSGTVTARLDGHQGAATGIMLRDGNDPDTRHDRYAYLGADAEGRLVFANRSRDSRHDWQDDVRSPLTRTLDGVTAASHPWLRLARDAGTGQVTALVSADGAAWQVVGRLFTPLPGDVHAGVTAAGSGAFASVEVAATEPGRLTPYLTREADRVTLEWNKPKDAVGFEVYRTDDPETAAGDPAEEPEGWERIAEGRATTATDQLRVGQAHYRVVARLADGGHRTSPEALTATAEPLAEVVARAREVARDGYTRGSHFLFAEEVEAVARAAEEPDADVPALVDRVHAAYELLVDGDTLLTPLPVTEEMVTASTPPWGEPDGSPAANGWRAFDGDPATFTDTTAAVSWIAVDPGGRGPLTLDALRVQPRSTHVARANGTEVQRSSDGGESWETIHTIEGVTEAGWYEAAFPEPVDVPLLRFLDEHDGRSNLAEIELLARAVDTTLATVLLERADGLDRERFTEESLAAVDAAVEAARAASTAEHPEQEAVDTATDALREALDGLVTRGS
ncbi:Tat pathway signal protein [Streptomyces sp. 3MP-14]|uniref:Tat pathway signal protein n=1 Tax=Streptomyces mimosae TaxID=2586635 RepID=A0A5N6A1Z2_9ACTN|nr:MULTISPECIES: fibronectin type III domain-containing protein [Streptomyces]KAB8161906.1 Tat pathway signal protein [Streptomyces mimosae]KAB8173604.1 Tat pathway signal protein [Streptomyces sp. 3MP-14]